MVDVWEGEEWYHRPPRHQADSYTVIANPVSGTKYVWRAGETGAGADLGDQSNVRILSIVTRLTWATTQPTPLKIHVTIDGQPITHIQVDPVTATWYEAMRTPWASAATQSMAIEGTYNNTRDSIMYEGKNAKVEVEITWAVTQPTDLMMRVKWAKWP